MGTTHTALERACSDRIVLTACSRPIEILNPLVACKLQNTERYFLIQMTTQLGQSSPVQEIPVRAVPTTALIEFFEA